MRPLPGIDGVGGHGTRRAMEHFAFFPGQEYLSVALLDCTLAASSAQSERLNSLPYCLSYLHAGRQRSGGRLSLCAVFRPRRIPARQTAGRRLRRRRFRSGVGRVLLQIAGLRFCADEEALLDQVTPGSKPVRKEKLTRTEVCMLTSMYRWRYAWTTVVTIVAILSARAQTETSMEEGEGFVTNNGVRIWYKVEGNLKTGATPLLMIHGGPGATARPFERTIGPEIAKTRPVIYMDYRGAGRSDRPTDPAKYSFKILASDAEAIRVHLGIERWAVFGHSNGGATALTYALQFPAYTAAVILCNPLLSPTDLEMNMIHKVVFAPADKYKQARAIYKSSRSMEERFGGLLELIDPKSRAELQFFRAEYSDTLGMIQTELSKEIGKSLMEPALMQGLIASGFFQFDAFMPAADLSMPVLLLLGRYDNETSIENAMRFTLAVPDGYIAILSQSGHHPYLEEKVASAAQVNLFLSDLLHKR
jgi:proline iminopeptidase